MGESAGVKNRFVTRALCASMALVGCPAPQTTQNEEAPAAWDADAFFEELAGEVITHWVAERPVAADVPPVDAAMLANPEASPESWLQYSGNYRGYRHSPVASLTPETVGDLRVVWGFGPGTAGQFAVSPVVYGGIMYISTTHNRLFAIDARTGEILWRYDHPEPAGAVRECCGPVNRGVGIHGNRVFMGTLDAKLIAFDRRTGAIDWQVDVIDHTTGYSITAAPLVIDDRLMIGMSGAEFGIRSFFDAYDPETGQRLWRHYTVPAAGEPGAETWADDSYKTGGASTWHPGAYDPETETVYWATGNPGPTFSGKTRAGDNLYADSVLAVDVRSGERKWHFQFTPHNVWDWDGNTQLFLVDIERDGEPYKALVQANRNGFFYILDRVTGAFLAGEPYVEKLNWATLAASGRPVLTELARRSVEGPEKVCPGNNGGMNAATSGSFNPELGLVFIPALEACSSFTRNDTEFVQGLPYHGGLPVYSDHASSYSNISAIDVATGQVRWRYRDDSGLFAGTLSTAGGVVFSGNLAGEALGLDAATGERVWSFRTGSGIRSQPIAFELDGEPYLAIASGGMPDNEAYIFPQTMLTADPQLYVFKIPR